MIYRNLEFSLGRNEINLRKCRGPRARGVLSTCQIRSPEAFQKYVEGTRDLVFRTNYARRSRKMRYPEQTTFRCNKPPFQIYIRCDRSQQRRRARKVLKNDDDDDDDRTFQTNRDPALSYIARANFVTGFYELKRWW